VYYFILVMVQLSLVALWRSYPSKRT